MAQSSASLMKGRLRENSKGNFNVDDNASDSTPPPGASRSFLFREASQEGGIDFLKDDKKEMTWGRRMALGLMDKKWYNPRAGREDEYEDANAKELELNSPTQSAVGDFDRNMSQKPSLEKAWAYFEHVALYRYIAEEKQKTKKHIVTRIIRKFQKGDKKMEKAEPGEKDDKTLLYDPIFTPHAQVRWMRNEGSSHFMHFLPHNFLFSSNYPSLETSDLASACISQPYAPLPSSH
jgi:hypothetical protein